MKVFTPTQIWRTTDRLRVYFRWCVHSRTTMGLQTHNKYFTVLQPIYNRIMPCESITGGPVISVGISISSSSSSSPSICAASPRLVGSLDKLDLVIPSPENPWKFLRPPKRPNRSVNWWTRPLTAERSTFGTESRGTAGSWSAPRRPRMKRFHRIVNNAQATINATILEEWCQVV